VALTFIAYLTMDSMVSAQQRRNNTLRVEIKILDKEIEEINSLESDKQRFIARMDIIEKLQRSRPEIVHLFDTIVRTLPDGVYLTSVKQSGMKIKFEGIAQSSTRVSSFMRNIDGSQWLRNPELDIVQTTKTGTGSNFVLTADEVSTAGKDVGPKGPPKGKIRKASLEQGARQ
jgi:type IV pilus assembly protein PilN